MTDLRLISSTDLLNRFCKSYEQAKKLLAETAVALRDITPDEAKEFLLQKKQIAYIVEEARRYSKGDQDNKFSWLVAKCLDSTAGTIREFGRDGFNSDIHFVLNLGKSQRENYISSLVLEPIISRLREGANARCTIIAILHPGRVGYLTQDIIDLRKYAKDKLIRYDEVKLSKYEEENI